MVLKEIQTTTINHLLSNDLELNPGILIFYLTPGSRNYYKDECLVVGGAEIFGLIDFQQMHTYAWQGRFADSSPLNGNIFTESPRGNQCFTYHKQLTLSIVLNSYRKNSQISIINMVFMD